MYGKFGEITIQLKNLDAGDCFVYNSNKYIKGFSSTNDAYENLIEVTDLSTGKHRVMQGGEQVLHKPKAIIYYDGVPQC